MALQDIAPAEPEDGEQTLVFRCPKELEGLLPPPVPAAQGLPDWFKSMPAQAFCTSFAGDQDTLKRCPPVIDAMTSGFLVPLICDVRIENGEFTWDNDLPPRATIDFPRSPLGIHDPGQVAGTPLFDADRFLVKFNNLWTIETPPGYSLFFTHPVNRFDLPFTTLTGMVDCDLYRDAWINFPAHWHDTSFSGVLPRGTPIAQCIPVKREGWSVRVASFTEADTQRTHDLLRTIRRETGVYRKQYRA
ncbi:MAG TPA: hypothetical protein VFW13_08190 [Phenylobacterium sp.]|nr:hypothetical protein [Phenylobacterium sp.]